MAPDILASQEEVNPMRRKSCEPHPDGWAIHSTFIPRRDGPHRLEQAFRVLLDAGAGAGSSSKTDEESDRESRRVCQGLDREAGA